MLKQLEATPAITQRQLAQALGVSLGQTNYLIKSLLGVGWVELCRFRRSNNKMGYMYILTPAGISEKSEITRRFLERKRSEYARLEVEIKSLEMEISADGDQENKIC